MAILNKEIDSEKEHELIQKAAPIAEAAILAYLKEGWTELTQLTAFVHLQTEDQAVFDRALILFRMALKEVKETRKKSQ